MYGRGTEGRILNRLDCGICVRDHDANWYSSAEVVLEGVPVNSLYSRKDPSVYRIRELDD